MSPAQAEPIGGQAPRRAWRLDGVVGLVLGLVIASLLLGSLLPNRLWAALVISTAVAGASIFTLSASRARQILVRSAVWLSTLAVVLAAVAAISGARFWLVACALAQIVLLACALAAVVHRVLTSAEVGTRTLVSAISFYLLLGIFFAYVYVAVALIQGSPFFGETSHPGGSDFLSFSFATLTTTGFGNLVPAGQPGRMFASLEMLTGQLVLGIVVAGLVFHWRPGDAFRRHLSGRADRG